MAGIVATKVSNSAGETVSYTFRMTAAKADDAFPAIVTAKTIAGKKVYFYLENEADTIQSHHRRGEFYEPEELAIIAKNYKGGTFLDIGSNVGNHAIYAALFLGAPKVIAFEPVEDIARILRCNVALNDAAKVVHIEQCGLGEANSRATAVRENDFRVGSTHLDTGEGDIVVKVGDEVVASEQVGFIKIDTEGMEMSVLRGLKETIRRDMPTMFIEVDNKNDSAFRDLLSSYGYRISDEFRRYPAMTNYVAVPA